MLTSTGIHDSMELRPTGNRLSIPEIARRLAIGERAVYAMLDQGILPGIRLGRRWIVTRHAFESWEKTCGMRLQPTPKDSAQAIPTM